MCITELWRRSNLQRKTRANLISKAWNLMNTKQMRPYSQHLHTIAVSQSTERIFGFRVDAVLGIRVTSRQSEGISCKQDTNLGRPDKLNLPIMDLQGFQSASKCGSAGCEVARTQWSFGAASMLSFCVNTTAKDQLVYVQIPWCTHMVRGTHTRTHAHTHTHTHTHLFTLMAPFMSLFQLQWGKIQDYASGCTQRTNKIRRKREFRS